MRFTHNPSSYHVDRASLYMATCGAKGFTMFINQRLVSQMVSIVVSVGFLVGCGNGGGMSNVGVVLRISVANDTTEGDSSSFSSSISTDGRFVAFVSRATNLVADDTNAKIDIFIRDTCEGAIGCTPSTTRISVANDGSQANDDSPGSSPMSADGRYIAFFSFASNLVAGDTDNRGDIFVRDTCAGAAGCTPSTIRVSVNSDGVSSNFNAASPSLSADGRYMAFISLASDLVAGDTNGSTDVFVRDTCIGATGCIPSTVRVSVASDGAQGNANSSRPSLSADGRFVGFSSSASNLVASDTNGSDDVFVRDTCTGATGCTPSTIRVSMASDGAQGDGASGPAAMSEDGRYAAFVSWASNLVADDTNGTSDVFIRDTCAGATGCTPSTIRASLSTSGNEGDMDILTDFISISANGRFVAFASGATNLVKRDTNGVRDVFVRDTCLGVDRCAPSTVRVSVAIDGTQATKPHRPT